MSNKLLIGIDFGTSTNFITKYDFQKKDAVAVANMGGYGGSNIFNNCIYIENKTNFVLGDFRRLVRDPFNFFHDIKRFIISDDWFHRVPNLDNREVSAQDIAQMIFESIKQKIETNENRSIDGAVITVPYEYSDKYRKRLIQSAQNAGIKVIKLVEEPVAAAISFGLFSDEVKENKEEKIVVFDLGGGTFDIAIFKFKKDDKFNAKIEVLNTNGVEKLGGKNIDALIAKKLQEEINLDYTQISNQKERILLQSKLDEIAKTVKEELSVEEESEVYEPLVINGTTVELEKFITRDEFNGWLKDNNILGQIEDALDSAIYDIDLEPQDIDRIILAGGTSSIPVIKELVKNFFGKEPESKKNLGELVGHGAGILAGLSEDDGLNYEIIRKTSKYIGINKANKFQKILNKNIKYGESSAKYPLQIRNSNADTIYFYEGEGGRIDNCEKIGKVKIDISKYENKTIKISLLKDENSGRVQYAFYNKSDELIDSGQLEDV